MLPTATQVALVVALAVAFVSIWYFEGRGRWRSLVSDRFIRGVPWGTFVVVGIVVAFYLFAQGGLRNWDSPVIYPFVTWSYLYPTGLLTAGIAHGSPAHIISNMTATLALAPIAEYAWGHYAPSRRDEYARPAEGVLANPWVRAVVVFPAVLLAAAFLTSFFSLGPGLGFSGAVFAIAGFAVVNYPVSTVIAVVVGGVLRTLYTAFATPIVHATVESGAPSPPAWAGIGFQAHMLGFLLGVVAGAALLWWRDRQPSAERVFFGTFLLAIAQTLWLVVWVDGEVYTLYRGAGVAFVALLTMAVTVAAAGSRKPLPRPFSEFGWVPSRRQLALVWLGVLSFLSAGTIAGLAVEGDPLWWAAGILVPLAVLSIPAVVALLPERWLGGPTSGRQAGVVIVVVVTLAVALPSIPLGLLTVDADSAPDTDGVDVRDYHVTYAENATPGQASLIDWGNETTSNNQTGVIMVSDAREMWTIGTRGAVLEHDGNDTIVVGGVGWREEIEVNRTGWDVVGNDSAYAVDLTVDGETTRSFATEPKRATARIDNRTVAVAPRPDGFEILAFHDDERAGTAMMPPVNESVRIDGVRFETRPGEDGDRLVATRGGTEIQVAERESYA
ncbi:rhomboid family intramembrane serine protease [Natronomonas halophila]|uniref:rhomboid family intramembrane serine protease n=1 Tax=Natronomonas halophila TaxID=2747817 RepID=UPI0015B52521|nr:rhomboid family intramembrane serine protease [Natronomonas halophila]QLD86791.1 rhomboid family intramembrane serine protease [Natronomonas halophila]